MTLDLLEDGVLTLGCADLDAWPQFGLMAADGTRPGFEPDAAAAVAAALGLRLRWHPVAWADFYPALDARAFDALWCGQTMTAARRALADFTTAYAVFDESLVVRSDNAVGSADALAGLRIGAIADSANMLLVDTFADVVRVPFPGTADVFGDMIRALRAGTIDGFVDDDLVMAPLDAEPDLRLAFTVRTQNRWGIAVRKGDDALREALDRALAETIADGSLEAAWQRSIHWLPFPLGVEGV